MTDFCSILKFEIRAEAARDGQLKLQGCTLIFVLATEAFFCGHSNVLNCTLKPNIRAQTPQWYEWSYWLSRTDITQN